MLRTGRGSNPHMLMCVLRYRIERQCVDAAIVIPISTAVLSDLLVLKTVSPHTPLALDQIYMKQRFSLHIAADIRAVHAND